MTGLPEEVQIAAIALAASLAIGLPVRIAGWRAALAGLRIGFGWARRHKVMLFLAGSLGAIAGLWSFEQVRSVIFSLIGGIFGAFW